MSLYFYGKINEKNNNFLRVYFEVFFFFRLLLAFKIFRSHHQFIPCTISLRFRISHHNTGPPFPCSSFRLPIQNHRPNRSICTTARSKSRPSYSKSIACYHFQFLPRFSVERISIRIQNRAACSSPRYITVSLVFVTLVMSNTHHWRVWVDRCTLV